MTTPETTPKVFLSQACYHLLQPPLKDTAGQKGLQLNWEQVGQCLGSRGRMQKRRASKGAGEAPRRMGAEMARAGWKQSGCSPGTLTCGNEQTFKPIVSTGAVTTPLSLSSLLYPCPSGFLCHTDPLPVRERCVCVTSGTQRTCFSALGQGLALAVTQ